MLWVRSQNVKSHVFRKSQNFCDKILLLLFISFVAKIALIFKLISVTTFCKSTKNTQQGQEFLSQSPPNIAHHCRERTHALHARTCLSAGGHGSRLVPACANWYEKQLKCNFMWRYLNWIMISLCNLSCQWCLLKLLGIDSGFLLSEIQCFPENTQNAVTYD